MPTSRPKVKTAAKSKPVTRTATKPTTVSRTPKPTPMVPNRRVQRSTYSKMGTVLNNMDKKR